MTQIAQEKSPQKNNQQNNRGKNRQQSQRNNNENLSPQQRHQLWVDNKTEKAKSDDFNVIQQKTRDTAETVNFLNIVDSLMYQIRMNSGTQGSKIPAGSLDKYVARINAIKDDLNLVAAEMCRDTGRTYRPPRGYKNPLASKENAPAPNPKKAADGGKKATKTEPEPLEASGAL